jgi:serine/threonine-protein kinase RsbW
MNVAPSAALVQLQITSDSKSLPIVRGALDKLARLEGFSEDEAHALTWAVDEALTNVIKHGYEGRPDQPISVAFSAAHGPAGQRGIVVQVRDKGRQVDPKSIVGRDLADVRPGGLGVHIIKTVMDEFDYSCPQDGGMLLRMVKYVSARGDASGSGGPAASRPAQGGAGSGT